MSKSVSSEQDKEQNKTGLNPDATATEAVQPEAENTEPDGPVVAMKGVSGKVITGVVRVVKANKKEEEKPSAAEVDTATAATAGAGATAPAPGAPMEAKKMPATPTKTGRAAEQSSTKKPGVPGKVGNIFEMRREAAAQKEKEAEAQKKAAAGQATGAPEPSRNQQRPAADGTSKQVKQPAASKASGDSSTQAQQATTASAVAPAAGGRTGSPAQSPAPSEEQRPAADKEEIKKPGTPGKVGNIFDLQNQKGGAKSSLAATAEMHAQRVARKRHRKEEQAKSRFESRPGGRGAVFPDKDKDADEEAGKFRSRPRRQSRPAAAEDNPFASGKNEGRSRRGGNRRNQGNGRNDHRHEDGRRGRRTSGSDFLERHARINRQNRKQEAENPAQRAVLTHVSLPAEITVKEFAEAIKKTTAEVIKKLMKFGVMATINQVLDYETASIIAGEFEIETDKLVEVTEEDILFDDSDDAPEDLVARPPVVVVMGHVDHGKTSLLDYYRQSSVTADEAGGITQHIGAYTVTVKGEKITFLDTPGHEAFTTMRARGAMVTDVAILVVAVDDGVMPQTIEAINHAKAADTQIIVAINKIDKEGDPNRVKQELSNYGLIPEEWGGDTVMVPVSAKTGQGMDELLEMILLTTEVMELKANPNRQAKGTVIEAKLDRHRGPVATLLVQRGTLHTGETVVTGTIVGNVRLMTDATGQQIKEAGPSVPVEITGLPEVPEAGEIFYAVADEKMAKQLAEKRRAKQREEEINKTARVSLDTLFNQLAEGEVKDLNLIVKADVQGSVEAIKQSLERLSNDEVNVRVVHGAVGAITETDLRLAEVSNAIVIGFNVRPATNVEDMAKESNIDMRLYRVIYDAIEDIEAAMKGLLAPKFEEVRLGTIELREVFKISSVGTVGGGYVQNGKITRRSHVRVVRDGVVVAEDEVASLRRFKDDVREVGQGYECGVTLDRFHDLKVGDVIESYEMKEIES